MIVDTSLNHAASEIEVQLLTLQLRAMGKMLLIFLG